MSLFKWHWVRQAQHTHAKQPRIIESANSKFIIKPMEIARALESGTGSLANIAFFTTKSMKIDRLSNNAEYRKIQ